MEDTKMILSNGWLSNFVGERYKKKIVTLDDAFNDHRFDEIVKFRHRDPDGRILFYTEDPVAVYEYFKSLNIIEFVPWHIFNINGEYMLGYNFDFEFKSKKKHKKKGKIPSEDKEKIDTVHLKIKGQKPVYKGF